MERLVVAQVQLDADTRSTHEFRYMLKCVFANAVDGGECCPCDPACCVADDHPGMMKAICRLLALDCEVVGSVADGGALLEAAQRLQPDVIVLDVNLPTVHGLEACRQITQANPEMKVIVLTALDDPVVRQRSFAVGASAFVCKLELGDHLLSAINACVSTEVD